MSVKATRPRAIALFELFFFTHFAILALVNWSNRAAWTRLAEQSKLGVTLGVLIVIGIELLLWFTIARLGSNIARWIYCVLFLLNLAGVLLSFLSGWWPGGFYGGLAAIGVAAHGIAVWVLFVPNADPWFKRKRAA